METALPTKGTSGATHQSATSHTSQRGGSAADRGDFIQRSEYVSFPLHRDGMHLVERIRPNELAATQLDLEIKLLLLLANLLHRARRFRSVEELDEILGKQHRRRQANGKAEENFEH